MHRKPALVFGSHAVPMEDPLRPLADRAIAGSDEAMSELMALLVPRLVGAVRAVIGSADVEDVVQESLIRLARALGTFRGESSVAYFATRVALHAATDHIRRRQTRRRYEEEAAEQYDDTSGAMFNPALSAQRRSRLRFLLDELPEVQAETLILFALGYSLQEIAQGMKVPLETTRSRLRLARQVVRARIQGDPALRDLLTEPT